MIYEIWIEHDSSISGEQSLILVEGEDSFKEIKQFLITRGISENKFKIFKRKPLSLRQFKNLINKNISDYKKD